MSEKYSLVKWNAAKKAIVEAKSIDEVKGIRDKAMAMQAYAKQIGESLEVQNDICEIKLRAERRAGEMLKETELNKGRPSEKGLHDVTVITKLSDLGIDKHESSRWQKIAGIPEKQFESLINEVKEDNKELTESFLLSTVKKIDRIDKIEKQKKAIEKGELPLPKGTFEIIVMDPPWPYSRDGTSYDPTGNRAMVPYPEMSMEKLEEIYIPGSEDCVLWLWTTNAFMKDAYHLLKVWGFEDKTILTWNKEFLGAGWWLRNITEHCILAVKGEPRKKGFFDNKKWTTLISEKRTQHSVKPELFYKLVDEVCTGRKLDYFARKKRDGWEVWGDEVTK